MGTFRFIGSVLFAIIFSISACTNDAEKLPGSEIKLTSNIAPSRVTSLDYQSTQIVEGQQVGVTIIGAQNEHNNVAWNVGSGGALTNTGNSVYWGDGQATIIAYHPFNDDWDENTSYAFSVNTDQSSEENYRNSDLLWAAATSSKTETAIPLIFSHKLAKINVTLKSEDIEDLSGATISICGTNITTNFNPVDGTLSAATTNIQEIKAGVTTSTAYTASAIVVPQTVANGTKFIKITHNDRTFYYTLSTNKELKSGCSHNYTLTIKEKEVTTESDKITDWEDDDNIGDAEEIEPTIPNNQIWYTSTDGNIVAPYVTGAWDIKNAFGANIESNVYENGKGIITFDGDVTDINNYAFWGCSSLTSITISNSVPRINSSAFSGCTSLTNITIPNSVKKIGGAAFQDCTSLTNITIPNSVTKIESSAFSGCSSLTSIVIPSSVTVIEKGAFANCSSLSNIVVEEGNTVYDSRNNCNAIVETISNRLIQGCKNTIISSSVTMIGQCAFMGCTSLSSITIPSSVTMIGHSAFRGCTSLSSITIPSSVTSIEEAPFENCTSLSSIVVESGNAVYDSRENCNALIETASNTLIQGCENTVIPNSVINIGSSAFSACTFSNITIPNNVKNIGDWAFANCASLAIITIPNSVTSIGFAAFEGCKTFTSITIPNSVIEIGQSAFYGCSSLKYIYIKAANPPTIYDSTFEFDFINYYVPAESLEAYKAADFWKYLNLIAE